MGLTNQERINFNSKVLAAKVIDNNQVGQWFESKFPYSPNTPSQRVLIDFQLFLDNPANTLSEAQTNASTVLSGVCLDYSNVVNAVRLTNVVGTNSTTWVAKEIYGDLSSNTIQDWIQPQAVPQSNGNPSFGYAIALYDGDPNSGGTLILTTDGQTGSGPNASVGWIWNYDLGLLFLSDDFKGTISDPYVMGFVYDGTYLSDYDLTGSTSGDTFIETGYTSGNTIVLERNDGVDIEIDLPDFSATTYFSALTDTNVTNPQDGELVIYSSNTLINLGFTDIYFTSSASTGVNTTIYDFNSEGQPTPLTNFNFYINGIQQNMGITRDYVLSGDTLVWTGNKHEIDNSDILFIKYI